jgi:hypothetical protein
LIEATRSTRDCTETTRIIGSRSSKDEAARFQGNQLWPTTVLMREGAAGPTLGAGSALLCCSVRGGRVGKVVASNWIGGGGRQGLLQPVSEERRR